MKPGISMIAAIGRNRELGKNGQLFWHIPEDFAFFKKTTAGHPVIMGRKTWESIPQKFRPLPGRTNIVVTRNNDYEAPGATVAASLEDALAQAGSDHEVFIIGGAEIYAQGLSHADRLYLTHVDVADAEADAFFPDYEQQFTKTVSRDEHDNGEHKFVFTILEKE